MPNGTKWVIFFLLVIGGVFLWQIRGQVSSGVKTMTQENKRVVPTGTGGQIVKVKEVIDGVTVVLEDGTIVRYIGLVIDPCFAEQAKEKNRELVEGKTVKLEADVKPIDEEGRLLRYVWLDGVMVNEQLALGGYVYAQYIKPNVLRQEVVIIAQNEARDKHRGVWKVCAKQ